jgi:hypothetical protein
VGTTEATCATYPRHHDGYPSFRTPRIFCYDDIVVYTAADSNSFFSSKRYRQLT